MLEGIQAGRVEASHLQGSENAISPEGLAPVPLERGGCLACSPVCPPHAPHCPHGERSSHLLNLDAAEGHIWSVYLGNKRFLIPWQQSCLQSPRSNRAVFIEFLRAEYIHAWDFNSFVTVRRLVVFLSETSGWELLDICANFGLARSRLGKNQLCGTSEVPQAEGLGRREISSPQWPVLWQSVS